MSERARERVLQNVTEGACYQSLSVSHICTLAQIKMEKQHRGGFIFQNVITKTSYSANLSGDLCFWGGFSSRNFSCRHIAILDPIRCVKKRRGLIHRADALRRDVAAAEGVKAPAAV